MRRSFQHLCALALLPLAGALVAGCNPFEFDDVAALSSTIELEGNTGEGFGRTLVGVTDSVGFDDADAETLKGRIIGGGGQSTTHGVFGLEPGDSGSDPVLFEPKSIRTGCGDNVRSECSFSAGASMAGVGPWRDTRAENVMRGSCFAVAAPDDRKIEMHCEIPGRFEIIEAPDGPTEFGNVMASVRGSSAVAVIVSEPSESTPMFWLADSDGRGTNSFGWRGYDASNAALDSGENAGQTIAAHGFSGGVLVALGSPATSQVVVGVASGDDFIPCGVAEGDGAEWGGSLAMGDFDGDGTPDIAVGASLDASGRSDEVTILTGSFSAGACTGFTSGDVFACPTVMDDREPSCGGFGASFTVGDFDEDGTDDLVVGAPLTSFPDAGSAGAAYELLGSSSGLDADGQLLAIGLPEDGQRLGQTLTTLPASELTAGSLRTRDEPVLGAPGSSLAYVFLCSGEREAAQRSHPQCLVSSE